MLAGKSIYHVHQGPGTCFSAQHVAGYYNDLTAKVTMLPQLLDTTRLPHFKAENGAEADFPVEIFQYGLGAYDLYLTTSNRQYFDKFMQCVDWAMQHQQADGSWDNLSFIYPNYPCSAMAQGEGASLLVRAYVQTHDATLLTAARRALEFMLQPVEKGGTAAYTTNGIVLLEYMHWPAVLNGWVFAWWGLHDFVTLTADETLRRAMTESADAMAAMLPQFTRHHWSMYALNGRIASPHYHTIHIAQMQVMHILTGREEFERFEQLWRSYAGNPIYRAWAFVIKAWQKVTEPSV